MLCPEQLLPDDPWRARIHEALEARLCWSIVVDGAVRARRLSGAALQASAEGLLACRVVMAQRRHQQLWGPLLGVRLGFDDTVAVVAHAVALDEPPTDARGAWTRQTLRELRAVLIGLAHFQPDLRTVTMPDALQQHLPDWSEVRSAL